MLKVHQMDWGGRMTFYCACANLKTNHFRKLKARGFWQVVLYLWITPERYDTMRCDEVARYDAERYSMTRRRRNKIYDTLRIVTLRYVSLHYVTLRKNTMLYDTIRSILGVASHLVSSYLSHVWPKSREHRTLFHVKRIHSTSCESFIV